MYKLISILILLPLFLFSCSKNPVDTQSQANEKGKVVFSLVWPSGKTVATPDTYAAVAKITNDVSGAVTIIQLDPAKDGSGVVIPGEFEHTFEIRYGKYTVEIYGYSAVDPTGLPSGSAIHYGKATGVEVICPETSITINMLY